MDTERVGKSQRHVLEMPERKKKKRKKPASGDARGDYMGRELEMDAALAALGG